MFTTKLDVYISEKPALLIFYAVPKCIVMDDETYIKAGTKQIPGIRQQVPPECSGEVPEEEGQRICQEVFVAAGDLMMLHIQQIIQVDQHHQRPNR